MCPLTRHLTLATSLLAQEFKLVTTAYCQGNLKKGLRLTLSLSRSAKLILWCHFGEFDIGSTNNPLVDIFPYSHHFSAWHHTENVIGNYVLIIPCDGQAIH